MEYINIIKDSDFGLEAMKLDNPRVRIGARGLVFNNDNKIAILNKQNKNEYKLVGGGVDPGEDTALAFKREVLEEAGCKVDIDMYMGTIREERTHHNFVQDSYIYISHVVEDTKKLHLTQKEIDEGARLLWLTIDEAMDKIKDSESKLVASKYEDVYATKFIVRRDFYILDYYKNILGNKKDK